jgi:hypothetical protein
VRALIALIVTGAAAAALALPAAGSQKADECRGLMVCIPVAGPWVVIPSPAAAGRPIDAAWQLKCPVGIVAGLDARLTDAAIDMSFSGLLGSPVNPGITTTNTVVFTGTYTGRTAKPTSFRPFIGCIPTSGGGRTPTGLSSPDAFKPGTPTIVRSKTARMQPGQATGVTLSCGTGERLLSSSTAIGLRMEAEPTAAQLSAVHATQTVRAGRILATATRAGLPARVRADVQVIAVCTQAGRR